MRTQDVKECVGILANHPVVAPRYGEAFDQLGPAWQKLLDHDAFCGLVYEEVSENGMRVVGAGTSAFVSDSFIRDLKTPPFFWIGPEIAKRVMRDESPVLSNEAFRRANSHGGLNLVLWHVCVTLENAMRFEVRNLVSGSFFEQHRGFLLKELIALQATFAEEVLWTVDGGGLNFNASRGQYVDAFEPSPAMLHEPHIFGLTRDLALRKMTWISSLFLYTAPRVGFSASEQKLLLNALSGATDKELCDQLAISLSAVKKTWQSAYNRAGRTLPVPALSRDDDSERPIEERGKQKKQRLLAYIREHPEELRPVSMKLLKR